MNSTEIIGVVYDACAVSRILGIACEYRDPVPKAADGEIVIYYGGWDLPTLRKSPAGKNRMWQDQNWYDDKGWKAEPGYYRINLRIPDSNRRNWPEQVSHLKTVDAALQPAPVTVAATALLVHLTETGNDLLKTDYCRCVESLPGDDRAALYVNVGRVYVFCFWDDHRHDHLWLAASRKF
jgi:hypothetical protein